MQIVFRLELDKGESTPFDPAALEISRDGRGNINFTIIDGANKQLLHGSCEPGELFKLATMLSDGEE